jgi:hypothetical protein
MEIHPLQPRLRTASVPSTLLLDFTVCLCHLLYFPFLSNVPSFPKPPQCRLSTFAFTAEFLLHSQLNVKKI